MGLIDLPPGDRGYGKSETVPMQGSIDDYNRAVGAAWGAGGALEPDRWWCNQ